jgi:FAD/FMN-containing dehydrogenase
MADGLTQWHLGWVVWCALLIGFCAASLPQDLSNFQGKWACNDAVLMGKPKTVADLQVIVANAKLVKGVGAGHSWNQQEFCAGDTSNAVSPVMTSMDALIQVDEQNAYAKISAGILTADALDYLAKYGRGWTIPNFPWFTFQTIAGAVATGSHGSSMKYGSLSSDAQLRALDVVLANGSFVQLSRDSHPFLWRAFQVSVGRIGIITAGKSQAQ